MPQDRRVKEEENLTKMYTPRTPAETLGPAFTNATPPSTPLGSSPYPSTGPPADDIPYRCVLLALYILVLVGGSGSMLLMIGVLKANVRSVTTMAVLNLMAVHVLFLLTVPFRVYYYAAGRWPLGPDFCRLVSAMIHAHMYLTLVFYTLILAVRYVAFFKGNNSAEFYRTLHAVGTSLVIWIVVLSTALPPAIVEYGAANTATENKCFHFGDQLRQMWILVVVCRRHRHSTLKHQEFWVQVKNLCFVVVMLVCFVPYSVFRIYYVQTVTSKNLEGVNEVFLALTTLSCLDMLTFGADRFCRNACCPA
ncbi:putative G-protein coupled receptor 141 [Aplochiton taeniatus]